MLIIDFVEVQYSDNIIFIPSYIVEPIKQYGSISFINQLEAENAEGIDNPKGFIRFQWGIIKGTSDFYNFECIAYVGGALMLKLKDGKENYLLIKNFPYEEYEKSRNLFRSWGLEVRN
ncbi:hypothetical protein [Bartonella sp. HY761]|uniref:hypothetical protein n=1 Tax=Bartonella sp. HY761 TaxID=2979330 RepID=UPI0021E273F5|nr:hypothetical protein [Bartonella sp. HY761]UXN07954.1 hypothetical protein N6A79_15215 [Bartonella sp. HY761]